MKSLLIEISGHQTIPNPELHLTLQIGSTVYDFNTSLQSQTWQFKYTDSKINYYDAAITLHNKKYLIDNSDQDLSNLCYVIDSFSIDGNDISDILMTSAQYRHCSNESTTEIIEPYTNCLGYDGSLEFRLITPIFCLWLLDYKF